MMTIPALTGATRFKTSPMQPKQIRFAALDSYEGILVKPNTTLLEKLTAYQDPARLEQKILNHQYFTFGGEVYTGQKMLTLIGQMAEAKLEAEDSNKGSIRWLKTLQDSMKPKGPVEVGIRRSDILNLFFDGPDSKQNEADAIITDLIKSNLLKNSPSNLRMRSTFEDVGPNGRPVSVSYVVITLDRK